MGVSAHQADRLRELKDDAYDVIVVGAGLGGLTAAALLARRGRKVLVVDQHSVAGGNITVFRRRGWEFQIGTHYTGGCEPGGILLRILDAAGASSLEFEQMDQEGFDTLVFPDLTFRIPCGFDAYRERLYQFFPSEKRGIDRYMTLLLQLDRLLEQIVKGPAATLRLLPRSLLALRWSRATFAEFLDTCTRDPRLRGVLTGQHGDYALPPSRASAVLGVGATRLLVRGAYFPRGGGQIVSDRLAEVVEEHGGKVLLLTRVRRILVEGDAVRGVELESRHLGRRLVRAPVVISNADLKRTMTELVGAGALRSDTVERVERYEMAPAFGILSLGLNRDLRAEGVPRTNYWVFSGYDCESEYRTIARGEFSPAPSAYVSSASVKDPTSTRHAPAGMTNLQVMSLVPSSPQAWSVSLEEFSASTYRRNEAYKACKEAYGDTLVGVTERVIPNLQRSILYREVSTPLTHTRYTGSTGGTSYGISGTPSQFLWRRPGARTEIAGLFLCGASCQMGHGILGVARSGVMAAAQVAGKGLLREVYG